MQIAGSVSEKCLTMMVGAMVVARLVNDSALSDEISPSPRRRSVVTQTTFRKGTQHDDRAFCSRAHQLH
jgi:hypothetical protein